MTLKDELNQMHQNILEKIPELAAQFDADTEQLVQSGAGTGGPSVGDTAPDFELPDQLGRTITSAELRSKGPLVVSFYRGFWCPYCNLELHALQQCLPQITELGATLVAISPQLPDESLNTVEKNELTFTVLSDVGNAVASRYGLVFAVSEHLRPSYIDLGIDLPTFNGTETFELPVPGTFVIDSDAAILAAFANADYKQRMEPEAILEALSKAKNG
ncbi:MAG: peroxiredoxin-like family protein [Planctomycetota bacterium]|jgi:peroxiredoxin